MKIGSNNEIIGAIVVAGNLTIDDLTAPFAAWEIFGLRRSSWGNTAPEDQDVVVSCGYSDYGQAGAKLLHLRGLIARAKDALPLDAPADRIIARMATLAAHDSDVCAMGQAARDIGKISVAVPSNINVWSHTRGQSAMLEAAQALTAAVSRIATA